MKTILVLGSDRIAQKAYELSSLSDNDVYVVRDASTNSKRIRRVVVKRRMKLSLLIKMAFCELRRKKKNEASSDALVRKNGDLLRIIEQFNPERVVLFRAGLIINSKVLAAGVPILNIHCASIPGYGGLGAIAKALDERALHQSATLHRVTSSIDSGDILATEPYVLDPSLSYCANEDEAYRAGLCLLEKVLTNASSLQ